MKARENPFRSAKVAPFRYRIDANRLDSWRRTLANRSPVRWAIVGPQGTGKTVLLEDLAMGVRDAEWLKVHEEDSLPQKLRVGIRTWNRCPHPLFLDGGEALPGFFFSRRYLLRPKLVATLHRPKRSLEVLHETVFDPDALIGLVEFLTNEKLSPTAIDRLLRMAEEQNGDVRAVIRILYQMTGEGQPLLTDPD